LCRPVGARAGLGPVKYRKAGPFRLGRIKLRRTDYPSLHVLQRFGGSHERDKRAELVLREKSIDLIDFGSVTGGIRSMEWRESYRQFIKNCSI
jgi:hypothetical protein